MKKILVAAIAACMALAANAQVYVGGQVAFVNNSDANTTALSIMPEIGYTLNDNMAIGAVVGVEWAKDIQTTFQVEPYFRYSFLELGPVKVFADAMLGVGIVDPKVGDSDTVWNVGVLPGISIPVSDNLSFVSHVGGISYGSDKEFAIGLNGNNISAGLYYSF